MGDMDERERMILENELLLKREQEKRAWYDRRTQHREVLEAAYQREAAEAASCGRAEAAAEMAAEREDGAQAYARMLLLGRRQAAALTTCVEALEALGRESDVADAEKVDQSRDHVLRALRANFFQPPETAWERLEPLFKDMLPMIAPIIAKAQTPPIVGGMGPLYPPPAPCVRPAALEAPFLLPGQMVRTPLGLMRLVMTGDGRLMCERLQYERTPGWGEVRQTPGPSVGDNEFDCNVPDYEPLVTPAPAPDVQDAPWGEASVPLVRYWASIRDSLSDADLEEAIRLANIERMDRMAKRVGAAATADPRAVVGDIYSVAG